MYIHFLLFVLNVISDYMFILQHFASDTRSFLLWSLCSVHGIVHWYFVQSGWLKHVEDNWLKLIIYVCIHKKAHLKSVRRFRFAQMCPNEKHRKSARTREKRVHKGEFLTWTFEDLGIIFKIKEMLKYSKRYFFRLSTNLPILTH